jgi:hypothetical protein
LHVPRTTRAGVTIVALGLMTAGCRVGPSKSEIVTAPAEAAAPVRAAFDEDDAPARPLADLTSETFGSTGDTSLCV